MSTTTTTIIMDQNIQNMKIKVEKNQQIEVENNNCRLSEECIENQKIDKKFVPLVNIKCEKNSQKMNEKFVPFDKIKCEKNFQKIEKKFVPFEKIKCEKNCFEKVEKWCVKVSQSITTGDDWNKIIQREITIMKVKFPFLTEKQIKGKALDKFGIPTFMGDIVRQGPLKVVGHIAQNLRLNPVHKKQRVPPPFRMDVKRSYLKKSIKKVETTSIPPKSANKKSNFVSLLTENKNIQSLKATRGPSSKSESEEINIHNIFINNNKKMLNANIETPKKKRLLGGSLSARRRLLDRMINSDTDRNTDDEEEQGTPKKQIKLEKIENIDDLSDSEYNCIFTPRPRMKQKKQNSNKENTNPKIPKSEPICFCTLSEGEKADIVFDPTIKRKKVARNLSNFMTESVQPENSLHFSTQTFYSQGDLSGIEPFQENEIPATGIYNNSYSIRNDFNFDQNESQFLAFSPAKVLRISQAFYSFKEENLSQPFNVMDHYTQRLCSFFETSWQPTQLRQNSMESEKSSRSSNYSHRTDTSDNPWKNVTSQDFSNKGQVDPCDIGGSQKTWSQDLDEIDSQKTSSNDSQKTLKAFSPEIFNEESNDTVVSKVFRSLSLESEREEAQSKKDFLLSNASCEFDKNLDFNFGSHLQIGGWFAFYIKDSVDQDRIQKIIDELYNDEI